MAKTSADMYDFEVDPASDNAANMAREVFLNAFCCAGKWIAGQPEPAISSHVDVDDLLRHLQSIPAVAGQ